MFESELVEIRKQKKSVAIVGFASTTRDQIPWEDKNIQIWGLNKEHQQEWMKRYEVFFQLHPMRYLRKCIGQSVGDREHYDWLCQPHPFPIYCAEKYPEFPASVRYPIETMRSKYGEFFTSSFAYMAALAIEQGFQHVEVYGFDMNNDTEYKEQRDSAEYFLGYMQDLGISVYLPPKCPLLKGKIYAFNSVEVGLRQLFEFRTPKLKMDLEEALAKFNQLSGYILSMRESVKKYPEMQPALDEKQAEMDEQGKILYQIRGAMEENKETLKTFDTFYNLSSE